MELGLPPDLPCVLDRSDHARVSATSSATWPGGRPRTSTTRRSWTTSSAACRELESIVIDGRELFRYDGNQLKQVYADPEKQQEILLAAERVALENRLDLMNNRAQLYDAWRQIAVTANALKGVFNVTVTNQITTPPTTTNPFGFSDQVEDSSRSCSTPSCR